MFLLLIFHAVARAEMTLQQIAPFGSDSQSLSNPKIVAVLPDGHWALVGYGSGAISLDAIAPPGVWYRSHECNILQGHSKNITGIAITPDGNKAISTSWDRTVRIWDLNTCSQLMSHTDENQSISVAVTPDGKYAVTGHGAGTVYIWDMINNRLARTVSTYAYVPAVSVMPDSIHAITGDGFGKLIMWDITTGSRKLEFKGGDSVVRSLAISQDGSLLAAAREDNTLEVWDIANNTQKNLITTSRASSHYITTMSFQADNNRIVTAVDGFYGTNALTVWNLDNNLSRRMYLGEVNNFQHFSMTADKKYLVVIGERRNKLNLYDVATSNIVRSVEIGKRLK